MSVERLNRSGELASLIAEDRALIEQEVSRTTGAISPASLADIAVEIVRADRVFLAAAGRSGLVLRMAAMRLMHLGLTVHVAGDTTTPAVAAGDLLIAASGSGTTSGVVASAKTALKVGARLGVFTANAESPLARLADVTVVIPAAQKTDHGSDLSRQYAGSLFEQSLLVATEAVFQTLWGQDGQPAEQLWARHANLE